MNSNTKFNFQTLFPPGYTLKPIYYPKLHGWVVTGSSNAARGKGFLALVDLEGVCTFQTYGNGITPCRFSVYAEDLACFTNEQVHNRKTSDTLYFIVCKNLKKGCKLVKICGATIPVEVYNYPKLIFPSIYRIGNQILSCVCNVEQSATDMYLNEKLLVSLSPPNSTSTTMMGTLDLVPFLRSGPDGTLRWIRVSFATYSNNRVDYLIDLINATTEEYVDVEFFEDEGLYTAYAVGDEGQMIEFGQECNTDCGSTSMPGAWTCTACKQVKGKGDRHKAIFPCGHATFCECIMDRVTCPTCIEKIEKNGIKDINI